MVMLVVVDRARGRTVGFDDANGRIGVVGRGGSDNGAAWERETHVFLFFPFFHLEKGMPLNSAFRDIISLVEYDIISRDNPRPSLIMAFYLCIGLVVRDCAR